MKTLVLTTLLTLAALAHANPNFTQELKVGDKKLSLLGVGTRKATIFKVKVYDAALYVEDKAKVDPADESVKVVRMEFLRDVSAGDIKKAWQEGLEKSCPHPCSVDFKEFLENVGAMKKGEFLQYTLWPDHVKVEQPSKTDEYTQKGMATALLKTWIGDQPPNPELKNGMLGR